MNIEILTQEIRSYCKYIHRLEGQWDAVQDTWGALLAEEANVNIMTEAEAEGLYDNIAECAEKSANLECALEGTRHMIGHLYCALEDIDSEAAVFLQKELEIAEVKIPYGWRL